MPKLTVIATSEPSSELRKRIERLARDVEYSLGLDVIKDEKVQGKYELIIHNGEADIDRQSVRVVNRMIIAGKAAGTIEAMLRENKTPFRRYDKVELTNPNAPKIRLHLPKQPNLTYNVRKVNSSL